MKNYFLILITISALIACKNETPNSNAKPVVLTNNSLKDNFQDYWYQGKAEITSFDLKQARYGEIHEGHAVQIFVTEDFSKSKKVKLDNPSLEPKDAVPVLKLNHTRKFNTGIYPYSMMTSVFTPVDRKKHGSSLKLSHTSQEWCGHTYLQLEAEKNYFDYKLFSYFESEWDVDNKTGKALLEDELWILIRIAPDQLPTGNHMLFPAADFARFKHIDYNAIDAELSLTKNKDITTYKIDYQSLERNIEIQFQTEFPHQILGWTESYKSGFGPKARTLSTTATRKKSILTDYWAKHDVEDLVWREKLGLN